VTAGVVVTAALLYVSNVSANNACVKDARHDSRDCLAGCVEDFQQAKDACLNRDHACVDQCREAREGCRDATGLPDALAACDDQLDEALKTCRKVTCPTGAEPCLNDCIAGAQLDAFTCRDTARDSRKGALRECRKQFETCAKSCTILGGPPIDETCVANAKNTEKTVCSPTCVELYQTEKDACNGLDHACVEACRATRSDCRAPILANLASENAVCVSVEKNTIQNTCPTAPDPQQCVEDAEIAEFLCRKANADAVAPDLGVCATAFQACVHPACELP